VTHNCYLHDNEVCPPLVDVARNFFDLGPQGWWRKVQCAANTIQSIMTLAIAEGSFLQANLGQVRVPKWEKEELDHHKLSLLHL
jgi:hypothetical protein